MKKILVAFTCMIGLSLSAQITTPQPSPAAKVWQTVGLTEITLEYSRPSKNDRVIFGDLVPYDKMWRTGANKNSMITVSSDLTIGTQTLKAGTYSIFVTPKNGTSWDVFFYTDTENWGTPETWNEELVALKTTATVSKMASVMESFTIEIENLSMNGADLSFAWENTKAVVSFSVPTKESVLASIEKTMSGPSAGDYYKTASYYLAEKMELEKALEYINKALDMSDKPFYYLRRKALIQAELGDFKGATATAKLSLEAAKKAGNDDYVKMNEDSIAEWSKKK
jgi:hypothetical protein